MEDQFFKALNSYTIAGVVFAGFLLRYLVFAGGSFLLFYWLLRKKWFRRKVQQKYPGWDKMRMEIGYSLSTFVIFALMGVLVRTMYLNGWTLMYDRISDYGWPYFFLSILLMLILHDTWFYWSHRFMHLKAVFPIVHKVHHLSNTPTPWTSFSFHPIEAVFEGAIFPLIVICIPAHFMALLIFLLLMTIMNVNGHLGYELFPKFYSRTWMFRITNSTSHHDMHHRLVKSNYGLYFNYWDRMMGTNHKDYKAQFDALHQRPKEKS